MHITENLNIVSLEAMPSPAEVKKRLPLSERAARAVEDGRLAIQQVLDRQDPRLIVIVGPCSIHESIAGRDYAQRLMTLAQELSDTLLIVMRVYFEKPRTSTGWKGFINDPRLDDSFHIEEGMHLAREFLLSVGELGLPAATEALDPVSPQYLGDLVSWTAIGARTAESQTHREMSSGLSTPVGFKNGTDGSVETAVNGILSASKPHSFLGINETGRSAIVRTRGNRYGHLVLRGGAGRPNYDSVSVAMAENLLAQAGLPASIIVDCSHANSFKKPDIQPLVAYDLARQIEHGNRSIVGIMLESFIEGGQQPIPKDLAQMRYGCSVTDACLDWHSTVGMLNKLADELRDVLPRRLVA